MVINSKLCRRFFSSSGHDQDLKGWKYCLFEKKQLKTVALPVKLGARWLCLSSKRKKHGCHGNSECTLQFKKNAGIIVWQFFLSSDPKDFTVDAALPPGSSATRPPSLKTFGWGVVGRHQNTDGRNSDVYSQICCLKF